MTQTAECLLRRRALGAAICALLAAACGDPRADVDAWLACEECPRELPAVLAHGDDALEPLLVALYFGASAPQQRNFAAQTAEQYRLAHQAALASPGSLSVLSDSATFVAAGVSDLVQGFQLRAAWALRALNTPAARAALQQATLDQAAGFVGWPTELETMVKLLNEDDPVTAVSITSLVRVLAVNDSVQLVAVVAGPIPVPPTVAWVTQMPLAVSVSATGMAKRVGAVGSATIRACSTAAPTVCGQIVIGVP